MYKVWRVTKIVSTVGDNREFVKGEGVLSYIYSTLNIKLIFLKVFFYKFRYL